MRNGHYTAGDIEELTIVPANKKKDIIQTAYGRVSGVLIWSNGLDITIGELSQKKNYKQIEKIPTEYQLVAEIIRKKANGRGGRRLGAGRPKTVGILNEKKTRSFKLTEYEYMKVKEYILYLRKE
ncbi:hypothetical protein [Selenomonas ruminantium]|uniref:hypothetical protein n=1 Tax=Selenomonas ruminantium TaxID=971 RepID=UPI0026F0B73F|nr:hypothetical protein [Selenomonas ruminantium]